MSDVATDSDFRCRVTVPGGRAQLAAAALAVVVASAACTSASPSSTAPATPGSPTALPATESPIPTTSPAASGDPVAVADAVCRDSTFRDPGRLTVSATLGDLVTIVYTSPEGDFICQYQPVWGSTAVVQGGFTHLADELNAGTPMVRDPNASWTSETGTYVWGAIGPEVASVVIELGAPDARVEAMLGDEYFLAVIGPDVPCCLYTAVALDADGRELARAQ